jgi:hypothetical protein
VTTDQLAQYWAMIAHQPAETSPDDPRWRPWHVRAGDEVEVVVLRRAGAPDVLGRHPVVAADPEHFKLRDARVFTQGGWLMTRSKRSALRARKVRA